MSSVPPRFTSVTVLTKANVYFDGKVVSHTILFAGGAKKTLGLIHPGKFHFATQAAERMEISAGNCRVKLDGSAQGQDSTAGQCFEVPANAGFDIEVKAGICEYICTFLA